MTFQSRAHREIRNTIQLLATHIFLMQISAAKEMAPWGEMVVCCMYALAGIENGRELEIDTTNNSYCFVENRIQSNHAEGMGDG